MDTIFEEVGSVESELVEDRRWLHRHPEVGFDLPDTCAYVRRRLEEMGLTVREVCQSGLVAEVGSADRGPCVMLRADMDALPMAEETGLDYASDNGCMHACGHDGHTAMALAAARVLKAHEDELNGLVRIVFQPDEEATAPTDDTGATALVEAGILENPHVDAVFALHLYPTELPTGRFATRKGAMFSSADDVEVIIEGHGCHGSVPHQGIDPLNIACHIYLGMENLIAREVDPSAHVALTFGLMEGGSAANIIPESARLLGTLRTVSEPIRRHVQERAEIMVKDIAQAFGGRAEVGFLRGVPPVENSGDLVERAMDVATSLFNEPVIELEKPVSASDDLAVISQLAPTCYLLLGCGVEGKEGFGLHHPCMEVDESVLSKGAALLAACAFDYLNGEDR